MTKNQFIKVTDVEQNLFEKLSGQKDKVLLLYTNELKEGEEEYLEYYFTYSDTTAENFGLETFYAKVKKTSKKNLTSNDLLSKAVSRLTEKMVKSNINEALEQYSERSSQEQYGLYFCTIFKGSFCCLLRKKNTEQYVIVTSKHNCLDAIDNKGDIIPEKAGLFMLKSDVDGYNLKLTRVFTSDYAFLSITPSQSFLNNLLKYKCFASSKKHVTGYKICCKDVNSTPSGCSGGNLHEHYQDTDYIWGVYNDGKDQDVRLSAILTQNSDYEYVG